MARVKERVADDFVILCRTHAGAQQALETVKAWMAEAGRTLHPEKTRVVDGTQPGGFAFLGPHFERGMKWPRAKSLKPLRERARAKTPRLDGRSLKTLLTDVNRTLRGWDEYFQPRQANTFVEVDG
jgi:RNA-directed DNA polymerase